STDRMLPATARTVELLAAQGAPQLAFAIAHRLAELPRALVCQSQSTLAWRPRSDTPTRCVQRLGPAVGVRCVVGDGRPKSRTHRPPPSSHRMRAFDAGGGVTAAE